MKKLIKLVNNHTLFVEGASTREEAAAILAKQTDVTPLGLMFRESGTLALNIAEGKVLNVPFRKIRIDDPHVVVNNVMLEDGDNTVSGLGIGVPDDALRLHCAFEALKSGMPYNWDTFLTQYCGDLEKIGSLLLDHVDTARIDGLMAQVITDPRVGYDEVGLNVTTMEKLHHRLSKIYETLKDVDTLDGMWILMERNPVVGPKGARWVKLRLLKSAPSNKWLVNAAAWKIEHDGDEDGDSGFGGVSKCPMFGAVAPLPEFPTLVLVERDDRPEVKVAEPVSTVMNMMARELTGAQHMMFHGLARATAVRITNKYEDPMERLAAFDRAYCRVFGIYHPMAEGVFDKRKDEDGSNDFLALTKTMESMLKGGRIDPEPFTPFLTDDLQKDLVKTLDACGNTTNLARGTAFGRLLMAGDNGRVRAFGFIVDALASLEIAPEAMIPALQADAVGEKLLPIPLPQQSKKKTRTPWVLTLEVNKPTNIKEVFEGITFQGKPVLKVVGMAELADGTIEVGLRLLPVWKPNSPCPAFSVIIPKITKVAGTDEHKLLELPGMQCRMFCPIFRMEGENIVLVDLKLWFTDIVKQAIESFSRRMGKSINQEKLQQHMDRQIRKAIRDLVIINNDDAGKREAMVRMSEYRVEISNENDTISGKWSQREQLLTKINEMGFDIVMTSKNKPGSIVTKAWKLGRPRFLFAINPFAAHLDKKREVEPREIRKALDLANPIPMPLKAEGCAVPPVLAKCITMLNVMVGDLPGWNVFEHNGETFCFDTLLTTAAGVEKLAIKKLGFQASDAEERDRIIEKLIREGFSTDDIKVEEVNESLGNGLSITTYDIVAVGPVEDIGKIKATVGPIKGVMNPVHFQLFAVNPDGSKTEIDLVVPHTTVVKKRAVDAVLTMGAIKAGITEIDPTLTVEEHTTQVEAALDEKGYRKDGKQQIIAVVDGNEIVLGDAIVGPLPFFRPVQTGRATFDIRTGANGIKVPYHAMIMAKRDITTNQQGHKIVDRITFHNTPDWVSEDFAQIVNTRKEVKKAMAETVLADTQQQTVNVVERVEKLAEVKAGASTLPYDENDPFAGIGV
jgi:hypothetical protein